MVASSKLQKREMAEANDGLMAIFAGFSAFRNSGMSAESAEAQALVAKLQADITANYCTCTDEILAGLGKMYVVDERSRKTSTSTERELRSLRRRLFL